MRQDCVGQATAAFGLELLQGRVEAGVHYPVQLEAPTRASILANLKEGAFVWEL